MGNGWMDGWMPNDDYFTREWVECECGIGVCLICMETLLGSGGVGRSGLEGGRLGVELGVVQGVDETIGDGEVGYGL